MLYNVNGKKTILAPGSLVVINPETLHACNPATEAGRSYYMLYLDTDLCLQVQQSMWEVEKNRIDDHSRGGSRTVSPWQMNRETKWIV